MAVTIEGKTLALPKRDDGGSDYAEIFFLIVSLL